MSGRTTLAVVLIALGVATFLYQGVAYATRGRSADLAITEHTHNLAMPARSHELPIPPLFGTLAYVAGIALLALMPKTQRRRVRRPQVMQPIGLTPRHAAGRPGKFDV
ncbi:MAG TPA: hypothetical protein VFB67_03990 [Candidatus Polarisedimenticolaceae bacterium]|nr:hypothetical protein [Candidatus Polarisedimenticolaceae bacterium]